MSEWVCWGGHSPVLVPEEEPLLVPEYWWGSWRGSSEPGKYYGNTGRPQHTLTEVQTGFAAFGFQRSHLVLQDVFTSFTCVITSIYHTRSGYIKNSGFHMTLTCRFWGVCKETNLGPVPILLLPLGLSPIPRFCAFPRRVRVSQYIGEQGGGPIFP